MMTQLLMLSDDTVITSKICLVLAFCLHGCRALIIFYNKKSGRSVILTAKS